MRLDARFYSQSTQQLAVSLLGQTLVHVLPDGERLSGRIVEVEAYLSEGDLASHSARGPGKKNASMFLPPGTLYVYPIHSRHCLNVVTESAGQGAAVLIRGLEPVDGWRRMLELRGLKAQATRSPAAIDLRTAISLTAGPGRLCQALAIDRRHDGLDLASSDQVWLEPGDCPTAPLPDPPMSVSCGQRIGISQAQDLPLRWFFDGHHFVSGLARHHTRGRHWSFQNYPARQAKLQP